MAFNKTQLENDLKKVFSNMLDKKDKVTDDDFADGISKACKDFGESGSITTVDTGAVSGGAMTFVGKGSGSLSLNDTLMSTPIKTCCTTMQKLTEGGDSLLATAIGTGILAMTTAATVETDVSGTATNPTTGATTTMSGKAKGKIVCVNASLIQSLNSCFTNMYNKKFDKSYKDEYNPNFDGDAYFAKEMASAVHTYFTSGSITTSGTGTLLGTVGTGSIS